MKYFNSLLLILSLTSAFADSGLEQLKSSFSSVLNSSSLYFDQAATLKPYDLELGTEISKEKCEALAQKIVSASPLNPFEWSTNKFSFFQPICGGKWGWQKNFLLNKPGKSNLGLSYSKVIQLQGSENWDWREEVTQYFISDSFKIVEIQVIKKLKKTKELLQYSIDSSDQSGNIYMSSLEKNYSLSGGIAKDVSGTATTERYLSADGMLSYPLLRLTVKHTKDSSKDYQIIALYRADQKDWEQFFLPITYANIGGVYQYNGIYKSTYESPNFTSSLTLKYRGGKEICSEGRIKTNTSTIHFPSNEKEYYDCINY